jgi:RNA polymerase sigma-70 factor (sigma-E family)
MPVPPSIEEFVAVRGDALLRFALMLCGNRHRAEDLVQTVLARAYPRWRRIATMAAPEAYLKRMLVNEQLRWRARRASREVPTAAPSTGPEGTDTASAHAARDAAGAYAERDAAWALLRTLPRRQRAVLVLRYYEDLSDADIAFVLGCRESTVRSQAARGLAALRAILPAMQEEWR